MNTQQLILYTKIQEEVESINARKYERSTRKVYKRYCLKFARILIENNIQISAIRNISNMHLKTYAQIEMSKGRRIKNIIGELRGAVYYNSLLNRNYARNRRQCLIDLKILEKYLGGE